MKQALKRRTTAAANLAKAGRRNFIGHLATLE